MVKTHEAANYAEVSMSTAIGHLINTVLLNDSLEEELNALISGEDDLRAKLVEFRGKFRFALLQARSETTIYMPRIRALLYTAGTQISSSARTTGTESIEDAIGKPYKVIGEARPIGFAYESGDDKIITFYELNCRYRPSKKAKGLFRSDAHLDEPENRSYIALYMMGNVATSARWERYTAYEIDYNDWELKDPALAELT